MIGCLEVSNRFCKGGWLAFGRKLEIGPADDFDIRKYKKICILKLILSVSICIFFHIFPISLPSAGSISNLGPVQNGSDRKEKINSFTRLFNSWYYPLNFRLLPYFFRPKFVHTLATPSMAVSLKI